MYTNFFIRFSAHLRAFNIRLSQLFPCWLFACSRDDFGLALNSIHKHISTVKIRFAFQRIQLVNLLSLSHTMCVCVCIYTFSIFTLFALQWVECKRHSLSSSELLQLTRDMATFPSGNLLPGTSHCVSRIPYTVYRIPHPVARIPYPVSCGYWECH